MRCGKKITGADYVYLALYAFAGIGLELILVGVIEPIFGISLETYTTTQNIIHWIIICIVWLIVGVFLIGLAKKKYGFNVWEHQSKLQAWQYLGIIICLTVSVLLHYMDWEGFKPLLLFPMAVSFLL